MRKLVNKWDAGTHWPKRLEWLEIQGIRGWTGQRIDFSFPFVAITGENGVGKSTILQAVASVYKPPDTESLFFASDFFPDTPWETVTNAHIRCSIREGATSTPVRIRKPNMRWRGYPERRERPVRYIDLRRTQPIAAQLGYSKLAKPQYKEAAQQHFDAEKLLRYSSIVGRPYELAGYSLTNADTKRWVAVVELSGARYSGFHQGAGEATLADLLKVDLPRYGIILIDEFETSLHPRAQRRLVRDLAEMCRTNELQIIVTTHSPYVLDELPPLGRMYVMNTAAGRSLVSGVSSSFAMTQMDDERHPDLDLYVEDERAKIILEEILAAHGRELLRRCCLIPFGAASVGQALGTMVADNRFPRPSLVFLDADQEPARGCIILPGDDAPERVLFENLKRAGWPSIAQRIARPHGEVVDALEAAMTGSDHHDWVNQAAERLFLGGNTLWRAMASAWASACLEKHEAEKIVEKIQLGLSAN
jgi:predicted ATPase